MFLFHSVSGYLAVLQKQNVLVSLSSRLFGSETKNKMFLFHLVFSDLAVKQKLNVFVSLQLSFGPVGIPYTTW